MPSVERIYKDIGVIGKRLEEKRKNQIRVATRQNKAAQAADAKEREKAL